MLKQTIPSLFCVLIFAMGCERPASTDLPQEDDPYAPVESEQVEPVHPEKPEPEVNEKPADPLPPEQGASNSDASNSSPENPPTQGEILFPPSPPYMEKTSGVDTLYWRDDARRSFSFIFGDYGEKEIDGKVYDHAMQLFLPLGNHSKLCTYGGTRAFLIDIGEEYNFSSLSLIDEKIYDLSKRSSTASGEVRDVTLALYNRDPVWDSKEIFPGHIYIFRSFSTALTLDMFAKLQVLIYQPGEFVTFKWEVLRFVKPLERDAPFPVEVPGAVTLYYDDALANGFSFFTKITHNINRKEDNVSDTATIFLNRNDKKLDFNRIVAAGGDWATITSPLDYSYEEIRMIDGKIFYSGGQKEVNSTVYTLLYRNKISTTSEIKEGRAYLARFCDSARNEEIIVKIKVLSILPAHSLKFQWEILSTKRVEQKTN